MNDKITRADLPGLQLALDEMHDMLDGSCEARLNRLIAQAQAAPDDAPQASADKDVHTQHCCKAHGCKYNDPACTVAYGDKAQSFPCEDCSEDAQPQATRWADGANISEAPVGFKRPTVPPPAPPRWQVSAAQSAPAGEREAFDSAWLSYSFVDMQQCAEYFWQAGAAWQRAQSAGGPAGCKVVEVELLELLREMVDLHERRGTVLTVHMEQLRAMLAAPAQPAAQDQGHPMQPVVIAPDGVIRFKQNKIVRHLLDFSSPLGCGLNELAREDFSQEDRMQLAQLIGYSVSGYGDLSYASRESVEQADAIADALAASTGQEV